MNYGIIVSEFNEEVVGGLLAECLRGFEEQGITPVVIKVPGAVEIPLTAQGFIQRGDVAAMVTLGCVVKGDTDHYEAVCQMCYQGIMEVMLKTGVPIVFEVLMVDDEKKALERLSKGYEAAFVATKMASLLRNDRK
jgi:6,7-dimethyl-8-ribityllumazine synthase